MWLINLDQTLNFITKKYKLGRNHAQLKLISEENKVVFLEFLQQSETRFSEHQYKVYDHFYKMYPILVIKVKRDVESGEISNSIDSEDLLEKHLFQASLTLKSCFHAGNKSLAYML